ncbi:MAG: pectin methylesterase [Lachnospiraceae bacterium]|nr:pectin methylesterase [Lachnospiraceae bacterium]
MELRIIPGADRTRKGVFATLTECAAWLKAADEKSPEHASEPVTILLSPGVYREKLWIRRDHLTVKGLGETPEETVISYGDYATMLMEDGTKRGTFRSYTLLLDGDGNRLENLTVENTAAPRRKVGQAVALYADGDRLTVKDCVLRSFQDTLFTAPLPPKPMSAGGFTGPKEFDERKLGHQLYDNCVIEGDVDFIFGSAVVWFEQCRIVSLCSPELPASEKAHPDICGYTTAASTPEGEPFGYVFHDCRFESEECPENSVYLGRPWRDFAKTVLLECFLGEHIRREGFHDWSKPQAHDTILYAEYKSSGPGASPGTRASFVKQLSDAEASAYTREAVIGF